MLYRSFPFCPWPANYKDRPHTHTHIVRRTKNLYAQQFLNIFSETRMGKKQRKQQLWTLCLKFQGEAMGGL